MSSQIQHFSTIYEEVYAAINSEVKQKLTSNQITRSLYDLPTFRLCCLNDIYRNVTFKSLPAIPDYEVIHTLISMDNTSIISPLYRIAHGLDSNLVSWIETNHLNEIDTSVYGKHCRMKLDFLKSWLNVYGNTDEIIPDHFMSIFIRNDEYTESAIIIYMFQVGKIPPPYVMDIFLPNCDASKLLSFIIRCITTLKIDPIESIDLKYIDTLSPVNLSEIAVTWIEYVRQKPHEWMINKCDVNTLVKFKNKYNKKMECAVAAAYMINFNETPPEHLWINSIYTRFTTNIQKVSHSSIHILNVSEDVPERMRNDPNVMDTIGYTQAMLCVEYRRVTPPDWMIHDPRIINVNGKTISELWDEYMKNSEIFKPSWMIIPSAESEVSALLKHIEYLEHRIAELTM